MKCRHHFGAGRATPPAIFSVAVMARKWITIITHIVFGMVAAWTYEAAEKPEMKVMEVWAV